MNFRSECSLPLRWKVLKVIINCFYASMTRIGTCEDEHSISQPAKLLSTGGDIYFHTLALASCWVGCSSHALIWGLVLWLALANRILTTMKQWEVWTLPIKPGHPLAFQLREMSTCWSHSDLILQTPTWTWAQDRLNQHHLRSTEPPQTCRPKTKEIIICGSPLGFSGCYTTLLWQKLLATEGYRVPFIIELYFFVV